MALVKDPEHGSDQQEDQKQREDHHCAQNKRLPAIGNGLARKHALDDQLFRALIVKFCADRQLAVDETVVSYLANRIERSYAAARQAVELLDTEALRLGRPANRVLAAELLRNA